MSPHTSRRDSSWIVRRRRLGFAVVGLASLVVGLPLTLARHEVSAQLLSVGDTSFEDVLVAIDFDGAQPFMNDGSAAVVTEVRGDDGSLSLVDGTPGSGSAARFPRWSPAPGADVAVVTVTAAPGVLAVGDERFGIGADLRLDERSSGSATDNGNNVVQRGLFDSRAQFKIQVDDGTLSCRISGRAGSVTVRDSEPIEPERWYRAGCVRSGDEVTLTVRLLGSIEPARRVSRTGSTGVLDFSGEPISIGGKVDSTGAVVVGDSDQFNGVVDNVVLGVGAPPAGSPGDVSRPAVGPYSPAHRLSIDEP